MKDVSWHKWKYFEITLEYESSLGMNEKSVNFLLGKHLLIELKKAFMYIFDSDNHVLKIGIPGLIGTLLNKCND